MIISRKWDRRRLLLKTFSDNIFARLTLLLFYESMGNRGAYTSAAASDFNGFTPTEKFYVCSVQPEHFEQYVFDTSTSASSKNTSSTVGSGEEKKADEI